MKLIHGNGITYSTGDKPILDNASFSVTAGKKYALIGPNGTGKTTLLRIITGELEADSGSLMTKDTLSLSLVPQEVEAGGGRSIREYLLALLLPLQKEMRRLEKKLETASNDDLPDLLEAYQLCQDRFERLGGYQAEDTLLNLIKSLGMDNDPEQNMDTLSGGEQSLLYFARALAGNPELLLLDEPGNHLDYLGLAWLERFLDNFTGSVIMVSHNRYMINRVCDEIWHLQNGTLTVYNGNYNRFRIEYLRNGANTQNAHRKAQAEAAGLGKRINRLQSICRSQYNPPAQVQSELKSLQHKLSKLEEQMPEKPELLPESISLNVRAKRSGSDIACEINNLTLTAGGTLLAQDVSFTIHAGEKVALVGGNGTGKTTLLDTIISRGAWDSDTVRIGPSQKPGLLTQTPVFSPGALIVADEVQSWGALSRDDAFDAVKSFLFSYTDMDKRLSVLSGGEKNRLQLARLIYQKANFLILDEPTNHMDIQTREVMEEVLAGFPGTILAVSHDRYFLDAVAKRVIEIRDGTITEHTGNFSEFFHKRYQILPRSSGSLTRRGQERKKSGSEKSTNATRLELRIDELETEMTRITHKLEESIAHGDHLKSRQLAQKLERLEKTVTRLYVQWDNAVQ
ncbi:MAG: ribosomal protection-like ABC-F family protein [Spirochaetota bacterium]